MTVETVTLTSDLIHAGGTGGVGWTVQQLKLLGVREQKKGWLSALCGTTIPKADYDTFLALKGSKAKKKGSEKPDTEQDQEPAPPRTAGSRLGPLKDDDHPKRVAEPRGSAPAQAGTSRLARAFSERMAEQTRRSREGNT
jgi:hypothetical protein